MLLQLQTAGNELYGQNSKLNDLGRLRAAMRWMYQ